MVTYTPGTKNRCAYKDTSSEFDGFDEAAQSSKVQGMRRTIFTTLEVLRSYFSSKLKSSVAQVGLKLIQSLSYLLGG